MKIFLSALGLAAALCSNAAMAQTAAEREACKADFEKYCPGVQPGGGRIMECLGKHLDQLTPQCKSVVEANMPK
ncbi:cysteine rich repeat-containing protein [Mesorhizobium sp. KR9-304]|uniref:cysteine rich repeat-containing protein n=1 Tax=Mesorhizobium sp. KR9-304 TaxID=3156614 RepID=UPI0032B5F6EC